jgi:4-hydroxybutyrate CoA-transferase
MTDAPTDFEPYLAPARGGRAGRITDAATAFGAIPDGARVLISTQCGVPVGLLAALDDARDQWSAIEIVTGALLAESLPPLTHAGAPFHFTTWQYSRALRPAEEAGALRVIPARLSQTATLFQPKGPLPVDAVLVSASRPGPDGRHSLGVSVGSVVDAVRSAPIVIAQVNPRMPYVCGAAELPPDAFDFLVEIESPLPELRRAPPGALEERIAEFVLTLVPDQATLQFGIGAVPEAIMARLGARRDLGVHSGMISDGLIDLFESGALTNRQKSQDAGVMIAATAVGTRRLFDWVHRNPAVRLAPARYSHGVNVVARSYRLVTINSAISVALDGSLNAETVNGRLLSGPGGQPDYAEAAASAIDGVGIVALPSTAAGGKASRIVRALGAGDPTTVPRVLADRVVTEYGIAELRGRSLEERAEALRSIAHPDFREALR